MTEDKKKKVPRQRKRFIGDGVEEFEILKAMSKIEPIDPPEKAVHLTNYPEDKLSEKMAMGISQKLRKIYAKYLELRKFGEMENAVLTYDSARSLAVVDKKIVGAISFHYDEVVQAISIEHTGTLMSPKGTGAELVRVVVAAAAGGGVGIYLVSTLAAVGFWSRLGFELDKKNTQYTNYFEADAKRVRRIKEALGSTGRVKGKT